MNTHRLATPLILIALFLAAWAPRILVLDAFVTVDERKWLNRSGTFFWALSEGEWAETFQQAHPGVTITWAGMFAYLQAFPDFAQRVDGPITDNALEAMLWQDGPLTPLELLAAGRWWIVLGVAIAVAAMYLPLRKLFGGLAAAIAVLFVAWSPFFLGLSHHLHPDGLLAAFSLLALLLFLAWLYADRQWRYLLTSAVIFGLALLTKTPAVVVGLTAGMLILFESVRLLQQSKRGLGSLWTGAIVWGLIAAAIFVLLWPAMWVEPIGVLRRIYDQMQGYRIEGHSLSSFFMGQIIDDPGLLFYPVVLFMRISPVTLFGLIAALFVLVKRGPPFQTGAARGAATGLLLFALFFVLVMASSAKKFDRYILPAFLALDILAAVGWFGLICFLTSTWRQADGIDGALNVRLSGLLGATVLAMLVTLHGLPAIQRFPYYALTFSPLAGGDRTAPNTMMIGWGEGLDRVGRWLTQQETDGPLRVVSWYKEGPLSYFLPGDSRLMSFSESDSYWFDADYVVLYANQWQRENPDPETIAHFLAREPVYTVGAGGIELAKVYDNRDVSPPAFTHVYTDSAATFGAQIRLAAYRLPKQSVTPGDMLDITFFLQATAQIDKDYSARAKLVNQSGEVVWSEERWPSWIPTSGWSHDQIRQDAYIAPIQGNAEVGRYLFTYDLFDAESGDMLQADSDAGYGQGRSYVVAAIDVQAPTPIEVDARWPSATIARLAHVPSIQPGQTLLVEIEADVIHDGTTKLSLRLVDPEGKTQAQQDKDIESSLRFELEIPADAPIGEYSLSIVAYDADTLDSFPDQDGHSPTTLSTVEVHSIP